MTEFRKYGRSPLAGTVKLKHRELGEFYAVGGDISATGVFLKLDNHPDAPVMAVGDVLAAELPVAVNEISHPETQLRVVRVTGDGVGLAFL